MSNIFAPYARTVDAGLPVGAEGKAHANMHPWLTATSYISAA